MNQLKGFSSSAIIPKVAFLTAGMGKHRDKLASFESALRVAGIAPYNLVKVSSIFPPNCKLVSRKDGMRYLHPGQVLFVVMSENATNEPNRLISASIGIAKPKDPTQYGYLSEHHDYGIPGEKGGKYAEYLAALMLSTILNDHQDHHLKSDEENEKRATPGSAFRTSNITQSARGDKDGLWTTVLAAMVLIA